MINEYLHAISGEYFSAKDFRTWSASVIFFESLMEQKKPTTQKEVHNNILEGLDAASKELGNTRNVCRKYYVHPMLISSYEKGSLENCFEKVHKIFQNSKNLTATEKAMLELISNYTPKF